METGKTLFKTNLANAAYSTFHSSNGYLLWYRDGRTEIWRRASDASSFQILNPDENQKKCYMQAQGIDDPVRENDPEPKHPDLIIKNKRRRGEFVPCGTITTPRAARWHSFCFPLVYICCSSPRGPIGDDILVYDVQTLELVRIIESVITGPPYFTNKEHALLPTFRGLPCLVDLTTFKDELLCIGKDSWWTHVRPGIWRRTITNNIFTLFPSKVGGDVVKVKLIRGMSPDKPTFDWEWWEHQMISPDGCDIVRAPSFSQYTHIKVPPIGINDS